MRDREKEGKGRSELAKEEKAKNRRNTVAERRSTYVVSR